MVYTYIQSILGSHSTLTVKVSRPHTRLSGLMILQLSLPVMVHFIIQNPVNNESFKQLPLHQQIYLP